MKRTKRIFTLLLILCLAAALTVTAYGDEGRYAYRVRVFSGDKGGRTTVYDESFQTKDGFSRLTLASASFSGAVSPEEAGKYYVKGFREAGKDSSDIYKSYSFTVDEDRDFVLAYGIRGDMVAYYVDYRDADGSPLRPDDGTGNLLESTETFYGNAGDKIIVSCRQMPGYQPQAYNLAKTLSENEAENVFTFVYTPIPENEPAADEAPEVEGDGDEGQVIDDNGGMTPEQGPQDMIDLDEDDTTMGLPDMGKDAVENGADMFNKLPMAARVGLIALDVAVMFLIIWAIVNRKEKGNRA